MIRFVWGVTLVAFMLLVAGDKICCPDGCTDTSERSPMTESVPHDDAHTCVLCVLGVEGADTLPSDTEAELVATIVPALSPSLHAGILLALDHPPRLS